MNKKKNNKVLLVYIPTGLIIIGFVLVLKGLIDIYIKPDYLITDEKWNIQYDLLKEDIVNGELGILDLPKETTLETDISYTIPLAGADIGYLIIPILDQQLPIVQGTGDKELDEGVGHFIESALPGVIDNCVLSAHRETYFARIGELVIGDLLIIQTPTDVFVYEVNEIKIVDDDDKTVIVPTDHGVLTLTTCYPFDTPGYYPERYIVSADLLEKGIEK